MSVRTKTLIVMAVMSVLAFAAVTTLSRIILEPGSNANERIRVSDNILRARSAVEREIAELDRRARDYASGDEAVQFLRDGNEEFIRSRLVQTAAADRGRDGIVFVDLSGRVVFSRAVPASLPPLLAPGHPLLRRETDVDGRAGVLALPEGAFLVSSRPVLSVPERGPAHGTVILARILDGRAVSELGELSHLPLRALPLSDPEIPEDLKADLREKPGLVRLTDRDTIRGLLLFKDLFDNPGFALAFDLPRTFHGQFLGHLRYFLIAFLAYIALAIGLGQRLMDRLVSSRLIRLTGFLKDVERSGVLDVRLTLAGRDEVARLASSLNAMLDALGRHVEAIKAAEEAMKRSEAKYRALFEASTDAIFLETQDGRVLDCNPAASRLFEHDKAALVGMAFSQLVEGDAPTDRDVLQEELTARGYLFIERTGRKRSGPTFPCEVSIRVAQIGPSNLLVAFVHDTTERARAEENLRTSLGEKELLLREVHHRVKNNMQIISSLLNLQAVTIRDPGAIVLLKECQARIRSMALVHEKLYQSKDMARVHFSDYVRSLALYLFNFWQVNEERIRLDLRIANILLDINTAIPLGLILNELISNALEHAYRGGRTGELRIRLVALDPSQYELIVEDDGVGLPPGLDIERTETLGLQLVCLLVKQLDGTIEVSSQGGTRFRIFVNALKYKQRF
jgi:two-component system, sensor histidine kinase PdtaS